jgi:DNA-binding MarR family transcriptional regulator
MIDSRDQAAMAEESREVLDAIRRLVQVIRRSAQAAEKRVGLSSAQLFVLRKLSEVQSLSVGELAVRTATSQSSVSEVVQRLVTSALVSRQRSPRDGRSVELSLTDSGRTLVEKAPQAIQDHILDGLSRMPGRDRVELSRLINRLLQETGIAQGPIKMLLEEDATDKAGD